METPQRSWESRLRPQLHQVLDCAEQSLRGILCIPVKINKIFTSPRVSFVIRRKKLAECEFKLFFMTVLMKKVHFTVTEDKKWSFNLPPLAKPEVL